MDDKYTGWTYEELQQLLFDQYINHSTVSHCMGAMRYCTAKDMAGKEIFKNHEEWYYICGNVNWDFEITQKGDTQ